MSGDRPSDPRPQAAWLDDCEHLVVDSTRSLGNWLEAQRERTEGLWLITWKKRPGQPYLSRWDVLDELLCHGWIDGARRRVDACYTAQWVSPRRHAVWTAAYRERLTRLLTAGQVRPAGLAAMQEAQAAGTWAGLEDVDLLKLPADLIAALSCHPEALGWFESQAPSHRRNVLRWLAKAKTPRTRQARIDRIAESAAARRRLPQL